MSIMPAWKRYHVARQSVLTWILLGCPFSAAITQAPLTPLKLTEVSRIDPGRKPLTPAGNIVLTSDGTVAIGQPEEQLIRLFSPQGVLLGRIAARGEGPGELRALTTFGWSGQRYWVYDNQLRRLTEFDSKRTLLKTTPLALPPTTGNPPVSYSFGQGGASSQILVMVTALGDRASPGGKTRIVLRDFLTGVETAVVTLPDNKCSVVHPGGIAMIPLCPQARVAFSPSGDRVVVVEMVDVMKGTYRITSTLASGSVAYSKIFSAPIRQLSKERIDTVMAQYAKSSPAGYAALKSAGVTIPTVAGVIGRLVVANTGIVWLQLSRDPATQKDSEWRAYTPEGDAMGMLTLPGNSRIAAGDAATVIVVNTSADDEETIVRYRLSGMAVLSRPKP